MKIAILNAENLKERQSRYEEYANFLFNKGRELGHNMALVTAKKFSPESIEKADFLILINLTGFTPKSIEEIVTNGRRFCKIELDYNFCIHRSLLCQGCEFANVEMNKDDPTKQNISCNAPTFETYQNIHGGADFSVFTSFSQANVHEELFGWKFKDPLVILPFYNNLEKYASIKHSRLPDSNLILSPLAIENGLPDILGMAASSPGELFFFMGEGPPESMARIANLGNCIYLGPHPENREDRINLYRIFQNLIYMPRWRDPCYVTGIEASLCEMIVKTNQNNKLAEHKFKSREELEKLILDGQEAIFQRINDIIKYPKKRQDDTDQKDRVAAAKKQLKSKRGKKPTKKQAKKSTKT